VAGGAASCLGVWGIVENFHEGWHQCTLAMRLVGMAAFLTPMLIVMALAVVALRWPWAGAVLSGAFAAFVLWFFRGSPAAVQMLAAPVLLLGIGFLVGRPEPRRWAYRTVLVVPWLAVVVSGAQPAWRVATRVDDGGRGARRVAANGVDLIWAPQGPGWATEGVTWAEAVKRCRFLAADGKTTAATPQDIWRLPTVDEAVRAQGRHGKNAGGAWDAASGRATYQIQPDKESPLWNPYSPIIYWWTATEVGRDQAYFIAFNGTVRPRAKNAAPGYQGFRAVRTPTGGN
jgi:hypothetical protein